MTDEARPVPPVLFVHVMKTGGTTLFRYLSERYPREEMWPDPELDLRYEGRRLLVRHHLSLAHLAALPEERRHRIRLYTGHLPYCARDVLGPELATVTILRHPVDRTISLLRQFRRPALGVTDPERRRPLADASLAEVYDNPDVFDPLILDHQTKIFSMRTTDGADGYLDHLEVDAARLAEAKANLAAVDVVGITERYDDLLDDLDEAFGWRVPRGARENVTPADDVAPIDPGLRRRIVEDNALDMELYEYAKELVALRRGRGPSA